MVEQLISFETAELSKEKGFNIPVIFGYYSNGEIFVKDYEKTHDYNIRGLFSCPSQSLLQKWLREVHGIYVAVYHTLTLSYKNVQYYANWGYINNPESDKIKYGGQRNGGGYDENADWLTYEEALENALKEGLKLV